jgi:isoquinoline 1-oxidoreductase beta subunit
VRIVQAVGDSRYGAQDTDASHSIREFFEVMRTAGAAARLMLIRAAAAEWSVPISEC